MLHTVEWGVHLYLFEEEGTTKARAELDTGSTTLTGRGTARCNPADSDVPEIGDELAAGRAMRDLARQLLDAADHDIEGLRGSAAGRRTPPVAGWPA